MLPFMRFRCGKPHRALMTLAVGLSALAFGACKRGSSPSAAQGSASVTAEPRSARALPETVASRGETPAGVPAPADPCPQFSSARRIGRTESKALDEASGLAISRKNPGVLWSHNDAPGDERLFAFTVDGRDLGTYSLKGFEARDWEDLAIGPAPDSGGWHLYIGDIGSNTMKRKDVVVYQVPEPDVSPDQKDKKRKLPSGRALRLSYPGQALAPDAETLMVDPLQSDLYLVTKVDTGKPVVYRAKAPLDHDSTTALERIGALDLPGGLTGASGAITAGDISADGRWILLRSYDSAYLWPRRLDQSIAEALSQAPCPAPLHDERQGEAIAWSPSSMGYFTVSEGVREPIYYFPSTTLAPTRTSRLFVSEPSGEP